MKVVVTSQGPNLDSPVDPRFGRAPYYIFADTETLQYEALENPYVQALSGAGIQAAQFVANKGTEVLLTGSCGPNAFQVLQTAGIKVVVGVVGTVREAIERFKRGELQPTYQPNVPSHFGMGRLPGPGMGFGPGKGRGRIGGGMGMGMGRGMGIGMGRGMGMGMPTGVGGFTPPSPEQEIEFLKQQAEFLKKQLEAITQRIKELEKKR